MHRKTIAALAVLIAGPAAAQDPGWTFQGSLYAWVPSLSATIGTPFGDLETEVERQRRALCARHGVHGHARGPEGQVGLHRGSALRRSLERHGRALRSALQGLDARDEDHGLQRLRRLPDLRVGQGHRRCGRRLPRLRPWRRSRPPVRRQPARLRRRRERDLGRPRRRRPASSCPSTSRGLPPPSSTAACRRPTRPHGRCSRSVGYRFNERWSTQVGWRYMDVQKDIGGLDTSLGLSGPLIGVSARF